MNAIRRWLQTRTGRLVTHDGVIALGVGYAAWDAAGHNLTWGALSAAGLIAGKAFLRLLLPVPAGKPAPKTSGTSAGHLTVHVHADTSGFRKDIDQLAKDLAKVNTARARRGVK